MIRFQRVTQTVTLAIFLSLMLFAAYPYYDGLAVDFFLRLDPLVGAGTIIAARDFSVYLVLGLVIPAVALLLGRFFCGHVCPMGTTLDILQVSLVRPRKGLVKNNSYESTAQYRSWKYIFLVFILAAAVAGVSLLFLGSPMSLVTRLYGLVFYPLLLLGSDTGLQWIARWVSDTPFGNPAHVELQQKVFAANIFVVLLFVGLAGLAYFQPRFWCRHLCPSGALIGLFSRGPLIRRRVADSCTRCGRCIRECPTAAISEDPGKTVHSECIVCLRCSEICPESAITFATAGQGHGSPVGEADPTRRTILAAFGSGILSAGLLRTNIYQPRALGGERAWMDAELIRPPGALPEPDFLAKCIRCGECMKACPTNTLQPTWLKAGLEGLFSPVMTPRLAACAMNCNVCGKVCPTGAVRDLPLIEKNHAKVGTAWIVRQNCLAWEQDKKCLVCDEVCPYNAVSFQPVAGLRNAAPFVLENRCSGCGWCENKCPVEGASAIRVNIIGEIRLASGSYVEKAREYGFVFKTKENTLDSLAPGTFDAPGTDTTQQPYQESSNGTKIELPPGFTSE